MKRRHISSTSIVEEAHDRLPIRFRRRTTEEDNPLADPSVEPLFGAAGRT
jgi:hypothetical protein